MLRFLKKFFCFSVAAFFSAATFFSAAEESDSNEKIRQISSKKIIPVRAVVAVDVNSKKIIYEHNADVRTQPASLAKMMTLLLTFQALEKGKICLNSLITVSNNAASQQPCKLGLKKGDKLTVKQAILALITKSANDAAVALAEHIGKSQERFVRQMNRKAKALGMSSTVFMNPSGWKNPEQLTTARDMSKLALFLCKKYPKYYGYFSTRTFSYCGRKYKNHNTLLGVRKKIIIDGIKTGFVNASGYNIVTSAVKGNQRVILVYFGGDSAKKRDRECEEILQKSFSRIASEKTINNRRGSCYSRLQQEMIKLSKGYSKNGN